MYGYKRKIELAFHYLGISVIRYRLTILIATVVLAGLAATQLPKLSLATSVETLFRGHDQTLADYQRFRDQFGRDEDIILLVSSADIFDIEFLTTLKQFHKDLENSVPLLKGVESLVNAPFKETVGSGVQFRGFLDKLPRTEEEVEQCRQSASACPEYRNLYFTPDGKHAMVLIKTQAVSALSADGQRLRAFARGGGQPPVAHPIHEPQRSISQTENIAVIGIVEAVIKQYQSQDFSIAFSGTPVYQYHVEPMIRTNMKKMCITILLVPLLLMPIVFGRGSGAFLPQITAVLGLMIALGLMALLSIRFSQTSSMLPSILLSIGLTAPIHFLVVYYKHQKRVGKFRGLVATMTHSGFPIAMTSFTTMAGLLSFSFSKVAPIADLVNFTIAGIFAILVFTLGPLPAFLSILQVVDGSEKGEVNYEASIFNRTLLALGRLGVSRSNLVVMVFTMATLVAAFGIHRLHLSHNQLHYFSKDSDFMRQVRLIEGSAGGFRALEIMIDTHRGGGITDAHMLKTMAQLDLKLRSKTDGNRRPYVGRTRSIIDPLREAAGLAMGQNKNSSTNYTDEQPLAARSDPVSHIAPETLRQYTDTDLRTGRMTAMMYWRDAANDVDFIEQVRKYAGTLFGTSVDVVVTGVVAIQSGILHAMMSSLSIGYTTGFLMIAVLMILTVGELRLGMLAMVPNLLPIVIALGIMGHLGIPLNTYNLIGGSIAIGLAVDDTIHFFHNFQNYYRRSGDIHFAVKETLATAGRALLATTLILVISFWMRLFSSLKVVADFGLVMGIALLVAFLADVLLAPALLKIYYSGRQINPSGVIERAKGATP